LTVATEPSANIDSHSSPVLTKMATLSEFEPPSGLRARSSPNLRADASLPAPINQLSRTRSVISWTPCFSGLESNEHSTERPSSPRELLSTRSYANFFSLQEDNPEDHILSFFHDRGVKVSILWEEMISYALREIAGVEVQIEHTENQITVRYTISK